MSCSSLFFYSFCILFLTKAKNYTYQTKYITLPVDHFSFVTNATFELRYLIQNEYWNQQDGPIFFYTGNEGDIVMFAENTGFMWEIAPQFQALIIFAEHRYYGESLPFGNKSYSKPEYLGYLTSSQALADYVDLIQVFQTTSRQYPVIAFGGSYGGMLAAWIRMKYPFIVTGAIASSAPILYFSDLTPCGAYVRIVTKDFQRVSSACVDNIQRSWKEIRMLAGSDEGKFWLSQKWRLCNSIKTKIDLDLFIDFIFGIYGMVAMINYPYPTKFLATVPAYPIRVMCSKLNTKLTGKPLISAIHKAITIYTNYTGHLECLDINQSTSPKLGEIGWSFQSCTEMIMPQCSNNRNDMFERRVWNFTKYSHECFIKWAMRPQRNLAFAQYGGANLGTYSNIVFSNGLLDPWSAGGILRNISRSVRAVLIPDGAHHLDLRESHDNDPVSVRQARNFHRNAILKWIRRFKNELNRNNG